MSERCILCTGIGVHLCSGGAYWRGHHSGDFIPSEGEIILAPGMVDASIFHASDRHLATLEQLAASVREREATS